MYKKTLSGLSFALFFVLTPVIACNNFNPGNNPPSVSENKLPSVNTTETNSSKVTAPETTSPQNNSVAAKNQTEAPLQSPVNPLNPVDGTLSNKAADANPFPPPSPVISFPATVTSSGSPSPSASSTVITGSSGQLNIIINPVPPCKKGDIKPDGSTC